MEKKRSSPKSIDYKQSFVKDGKTKYVFLLTFANGDTGQYISDTELQDAFAPNVEIDYSITTTEKSGHKNTYIFPAKAASKFIPRSVNPAIENRRIALQCAVQMFSRPGLVQATSKDVELWAETFLKFLNNT